MAPVSRPVSAHPPGWLADQLPRALVDPGPAAMSDAASFLRRFLRGFEDVAGALHNTLDTLEYHLDTRVAAPAHVRWLAAWLGRDIDADLPVDRQRAVAATAAVALRWRGTARGLRVLLSAYTGAAVQVTDTGGVYTSRFGPGGERVSSDLPAEGDGQSRERIVEVVMDRAGALDPGHLERLIRRELPADARLRLRVGGEVIVEADTNLSGIDETPSPFRSEAFQVSLQCPETDVTPGGNLRCRLRIFNPGEVADEFAVTGLGLAAGWVQTEPARLRLEPESDGVFEVTVAVPADTDLPDGDHTLHLRVRGAALLAVRAAALTFRLIREESP